MTAPVLVTGVASGIGRALAAQLGGAGREVVGLDVRAVDPPSGRGVRCDLGEPRSVAAALQEVPRALGGLALVAGVPGTAPPARVFAVNWVGTRALVEATLDRLAPNAAVVLCSSISSHRSTLGEAAVQTCLHDPSPDPARLAEGCDGAQAYYRSKHLLDAYGEALAERGVGGRFRAVVVSPGPVETPILDDFRASMGVERIAAAEGVTARHGTPDEVARVIAFALSSEASWLSGARIPVDGGYGAARAVRKRREG